MPADWPLAFFAGALLALAVGVDHHAEAEDAVGDLRRIGGGHRARPETLRVVVPLATDRPVVGEGVAVELVVEVRVAPRVAGDGLAGRAAPGHPVARAGVGAGGEHELDVARVVLLGRPDLRPGPALLRLEGRLGPLVDRVERRRDDSRGLVAVRRVGPGLRDGRQDRDVDRGVGAAEELEVGERAGRDEHEDDDRDGQLGCSGQEVRPSLVATVWDRVIASSGGPTAWNPVPGKPRESGTGPPGGIKPTRGLWPSLVVPRPVSRRGRPPGRRSPAPRA